MNLNDMVKVCLLVLFCSFMVSCSEKETLAKIKIENEALALKERKERHRREAIETKERELELARIQEAAIEEKRLLEEELLREAEAAEKKLADEKEAVRLAEIEKRQSTQETALRSFIKTKYDKLELLNGKTLVSAKVIAATPLGVKFMHQNGVTTIKYSDLPEEIRITCKYDEELEAIEIKKQEAKKVAKREVMKLKPQDNKAQAEIQSRKSATSSKKTGSSNVVKTRRAEVTETPVEVKPQGALSVKVVGSSRTGKTIEVIAKTNVDATVYLNDWYYKRRHSVKAGEVFTYTWRGVNNKYEVTLTAKKGGVLDKETSSRKSGIDRRGGL